jgi:hypothetical protein
LTVRTGSTLSIKSQIFFSELGWLQKEGRGCLFHHQPSPSSHLFSFKFSQIAGESGYDPACSVIGWGDPK